MLLGDGGGGKTTLALQLAFAVERGNLGWLGAVTEQGQTIFLSAEDPEREIRRRLANIAGHHAVELSDVRGLHLHFADPDNCLLAEVVAKNDTVKPSSLFKKFEEAVADIAPMLVIVDNVAATFAGDQIKRTSARSFINMFRALALKSGAAVLLLDHPSMSGMATGTGRAAASIGPTRSGPACTSHTSRWTTRSTAICVNSK